MRLKSYIIILGLSLLSLLPLQAEENQPSTSFGMNFSVSYHFLTPELNFWNLHYGLGLDLQLALAKDLRLAFEANAFFGFHKPDWQTAIFDTLTIGFPLRLSFIIWVFGFNFQFYAGAMALATAANENGIYRFSDFNFTFYPDLGLRAGIGTINELSLNAGCYLANSPQFYLGLNARLGLF